MIPLHEEVALRRRRPRSVVCIYSGGMDSYTLVAQARDLNLLHSCISFDYGQRHSKELDYAGNNCRRWGVPHEVVSLKSLGPCLLGSALTSDTPVPEGHYAEESMKLTVVPNRNMIMLSIAIAYAISHKLDSVWYGAHSGDHSIYPDCRPPFVATMNAAASTCDWHAVKVEAPLINMDKTTILKMGAILGLDYSHSWTCYKGERLACGKCGSCQERLEAFKNIGQTDPLEYAHD